MNYYMLILGIIYVAGYILILFASLRGSENVWKGLDDGEKIILTFAFSFIWPIIFIWATLIGLINIRKLIKKASNESNRNN